MVKKKVFVLWGEGKNIDLKIKNIRQSFLEKAPFLNTVSFDSQADDEESLWLELHNFSFSYRLFIIANSHSLSERLKNSLRTKIENHPGKDYFIFIFPYLVQKERLSQDKFYRWLLRLSPPLNFSFSSPPSTKSLFSALRRGSLSEIFLLTEKIFRTSSERKDILSLKILGIIARYFAVHPDVREKNKIYHSIFYTDRILKSTQLNPQYVLELLLLRLFGRRKLFG